VICVVKYESKWIFLDATERSGFFGYPSQQIQGRNIFIIDEDKGKLVSVPKVQAEENTIKHSLQLNKKKNGIVGNIESRYDGLSQIAFRDAKKWIAENKLEDRLSRYFTQKNTNLSYQDSEIHFNEDYCKINANISSERNFTSIKEKEYLSLAFLPLPIGIGSDITETEITFYQTNNEIFDISMRFDEAVKLHDFSPVEMSKDSMSFSFSVDQTGPKELRIRYHYQNELLHIANEDFEFFKKMNTSIKETLQKSIIYEKQQ